MVEHKPLWERVIETVNILNIYPKTIKKQSGGEHRGECALHSNSSGNSFRYFPYTSSWNCFSQSCKTGGNVINLYAHINNVEYKVAMFELAKQYNISFDLKKDKEKIEIIGKIEALYEDYANKCYKNLKDSKFYDMVKENRNFSDKTMKRYKVGLFSNSIKIYIEKKYPEDLLVKAGFINNKGYGHWSFKKRIVYPYLNMNSKPRYFIHRSIESDQDFNEQKYLKLIKTEFSREIPFGLDSLKNNGDMPLIITEGITDAMSVIQAGYPCISPVTIHFKEDELEALPNYCKRYEKTIVMFDNEEGKRDKNGKLINPGLTGAIKTLKVLLKAGINAYIGIIPKEDNIDKIDLDEFLRDNSIS